RCSGRATSSRSSVRRWRRSSLEPASCSRSSDSSSCGRSPASRCEPGATSMGYVIVAFFVVSGVTALTAYGLLRLFPAVGRERLGTVAERTPSSILRFEEAPRVLWQRLAERVGRLFGPGDTQKATRIRYRLLQAG